MDEAPFEMFVGERDADIEISPGSTGGIHVSMGDGYMFLTVEEAMNFADGLVSAAVKADPPAAQAAIRKKVRDLADQFNKELMGL